MTSYCIKRRGDTSAARHHPDQPQPFTTTRVVRVPIENRSPPPTSSRVQTTNADPDRMRRGQDFGRSARRSCTPARIAATFKRRSNAARSILWHITSIPNADCPGNPRLPAQRYLIDHLAAIGLRYWQVLPVNPTDSSGRHTRDPRLSRATPSCWETRPNFSALTALQARRRLVPVEFL